MVIDGWTFCTVIIYSYFQCVADEIKSEGDSTFKAQELVWETEYEYDPQLNYLPWRLAGHYDADDGHGQISQPLQARYRDMRKQKGLKIKSMWLNLGHHKINFVPRGGKLPVDGAEGLLKYGRVGEEGVIVLWYSWPVIDEIHNCVLQRQSIYRWLPNPIPALLHT